MTILISDHNAKTQFKQELCRRRGLARMLRWGKWNLLNQLLPLIPNRTRHHSKLSRNNRLFKRLTSYSLSYVVPVMKSTFHQKGVVFCKIESVLWVNHLSLMKFYRYKATLLLYIINDELLERHMSSRTNHNDKNVFAQKDGLGPLQSKARFGRNNNKKKPKNHSRLLLLVPTLQKHHVVLLLLETLTWESL